MENNRKCYKCGCSPAKDGVKLFRFPKPGVQNLIRCLLWARYMFPEKDNASINFQRKLHSEHRMLCQRHFKNADFVDDSKTKLLRIAIPNDMDKTYNFKENVIVTDPVDEPNNQSTLDSIDYSAQPGQSHQVTSPTPGPLQKLMDITNIQQIDDNNYTQPEDIIISEPLDMSMIDDTYNQKEENIIPEPLDESKIDVNISNPLDESMTTDQADDYNYDEDEDVEDDDSESLVTSNVCRVCLALDVKMYDMKDFELSEMFQKITGISVTADNHSILERLCWQCAAKLKAAAAFRNKALLSDALLQGLVTTGNQIRKIDILTIQEKYENIQSDLSITEVYHIVHIEDSNENETPLKDGLIPENNDTEILQDNTTDLIDFEERVEGVKEEHLQMEELDESIDPSIETEFPFKIGEESTVFIEPYANTRNNSSKEGTNIFIETRDTVNSIGNIEEESEIFIETLANSPSRAVNYISSSEEGRNSFTVSLAETTSDTVNLVNPSEESRNILNESLANALSTATVNSISSSGKGNILISPIVKTPSRHTINSIRSTGEGRKILIAPIVKPSGDTINSENASLLELLLSLPREDCDNNVSETEKDSKAKELISKAYNLFIHDHPYMKVDRKKSGTISKKDLRGKRNLKKKLVRNKDTEL